MTITTNKSKLGEMLEKLDLQEIEELKAAKVAVVFLEGRRRQLQEEIGRVEEQIAQVKRGELEPRKVLASAPRPVSQGGHTGKVKSQELTPRLPRHASLRVKIVEVLQAAGKELSIQEIAEAVRATGYQSASKDFVRSVNVTLYQMQETESAGRGLYRLKTAS